MNKPLLILILLVTFLLLDWYGFQAIKTLTANRSEGIQKTIKIAYWTFVVVAVFAFLLYHLADPDYFGKHGRTVLMSIVFMHYLAKTILALFLLIDDVQRLIRYIIQRFSNPKPAGSENGISRSQFLSTTGIIAAAAPVLSLSWGIVSGAHDYRVRRVNVPIKNLPSALEGIKILQLSDIHSGSFWNKRAVIGGVEMAMKEKPDLAFFTGDLVNNKASEMMEWGDIFSKIKAPLGVYSTLGNHDYGDYVQWGSAIQKQKNLQTLKQVHAQMGWQLLMNEYREIKVDQEAFNVVGIENWSAKSRFPKYGNLSTAVNSMNKSLPTLLLSHDPSHWQAEVLKAYPEVDLTLSGHTHGMQFGVDIPGFKWSPVQYVYDEWAGLYQSGSQNLYVNRGFGYIGYPGRVGILPEISILSLTKA